MHPCPSPTSSTGTCLNKNLRTGLPPISGVIFSPGDCDNGPRDLSLTVGTLFGLWDGLLNLGGSAVSVQAHDTNSTLTNERNTTVQTCTVIKNFEERRTQGRRALYAALRAKKVPAQSFLSRVRACHNETVVRRHRWPNTVYGRLAQQRRSTDVTTAWEYEQQSRNPAADECMRSEALDDGNALQYNDRDHTHTVERTTGSPDQPRRTSIPFQSRDRDPEITVERAISIVTSTYNLHPSLPPAPLFARNPAQARFMLSQIRTVPVPGGDNDLCPILAAFDMEAVGGTRKMCFRDGT